jgi:MFS family permease
MAYISQRLHIGRFLGGIIFIWGWVLMSTALAQNFAHAAAIRFLLGLFEAALTPSFIMITGMWYTRQEQPFRVGVCECNLKAVGIALTRQGTR